MLTYLPCLIISVLFIIIGRILRQNVNWKRAYKETSDAFKQLSARSIEELRKISNYEVVKEEFEKLRISWDRQDKELADLRGRKNHAAAIVAWKDDLYKKTYNLCCLLEKSSHAICDIHHTVIKDMTPPNVVDGWFEGRIDPTLPEPV